MKPAATENAPAGPPVLSLLLILFNHWHLLEENSNLRLTNDGSSTETNWTSPGGNGTVDGETIGWRPEDEIMDILVALDSSAAEFGQENGNGTQEEPAIISDHQDGRHLNGSTKEDGEQEANATVGIGIGTKAASRLKLESELLEQQQQPAVEVEQRLAHNVQPVRYGLRLTLDSESDLVQGQVQVEVQCVDATDQLQLHMAPDFVQIGHVQLESRLLNRSLAFRSVSADWRVQQLRLRMAEPLERGHVYYLSIWFSAHYAGDGRGLGRNRDKRRGLWLNTLFEPVYARRLFPCWDEPRFRASFRLDLWLLNGLAAEDYVALSGTEGSCQRWHTNLTICQFAPTPPIPTYILSLAVGRFQSVCSDNAGEEANNAPVALDESIESNICIWRLAEGNSKLDGEAMDEAEWKPRARLMVQQMADFQASMLDYLLIHPGGRLHLLVVPLRLSGMENFGLLNVRELLWPLPNETSQRFEKTLYHEMAHQWFGNLVTMEWWDAIWLAESLTTFMSSPRPIVFDASWDLSESAVVMPEGNWLHSAGQHIQLPGLVYTKGAALLEMLDALIGADRMRRLLRDFVRIYQFKAATTEDFLAVLTSILCTDQGNSSGGVNPISHNGSKSTQMAVHFLDRWLHLPSHPIVFVDFDAQLGQLCFSQTPKMAKHLDRRWPIPVWVECLEASVPGEQLLWIPDHGSAQLVIPLSQLTKLNSTRSLAFNRNRSVYYQISVRWNGGG